MSATAHVRLRASTLLRALLAALRDTATFVVLRNYEKLPEEWSNDVDILVAPADLERSHAALIAALKTVADPATIEILRRINFRAVRLACSDRVLQIDLYSAMCKGWMTYADTSAILAARRPWSPLFEVPARLHELLLIAAKELFSYGEVRPRYHACLGGQDPQAVRVAAAQIFGARLTDASQALVSSALADPTVRGRPTVRLGAILRPNAAWNWARMRSTGWIALVSAEANRLL